MIDAVVLAHEGGWDEFLLVVASILVFVGLLAVVKRRVDIATSAVSADDDTPPPG